MKALHGLRVAECTCSSQYADLPEAAWGLIGRCPLCDLHQLVSRHSMLALSLHCPSDYPLHQIHQCPAAQLDSSAPKHIASTHCLPGMPSWPQRQRILSWEHRLFLHMHAGGQPHLPVEVRACKDCPTLVCLAQQLCRVACCFVDEGASRVCREDVTAVQRADNAGQGCALSSTVWNGLLKQQESLHI